MARDKAAFDFLRPILDVRHAAQLAAQFAALRLAAADGLGVAQAADQFPPQFAARQGTDRGLDCFVRHANA